MAGWAARSRYGWRGSRALPSRRRIPHSPGWVRSGAAADFNLEQLSHLGFLIDDSPCPRSRLNRRLDRLVVAIAVMIRTWPFGLFRTDRCGVSRADCCDAHSEVILRTTGDPTNYIESLRLSAMSQKPGY